MSRFCLHHLYFMFLMISFDFEREQLLSLLLKLQLQHRTFQLALFQFVFDGNICQLLTVLFFPADTSMISDGLPRVARVHCLTIAVFFL